VPSKQGVGKDGAAEHDEWHFPHAKAAKVDGIQGSENPDDHQPAHPDSLSYPHDYLVAYHLDQQRSEAHSGSVEVTIVIGTSAYGS
jgi:hypothetical protein